LSRTFTKLFSSITESTIWCEPNHVRIVWICMLAMADARGRVWASVPGLANRARVELHEAEEAISLFLAPDKYSRTPDYEGRRIEPIDGGWRLLNHAKYRAIRDDESAKEAKRKYINARRQEEKAQAAGVDNVDQCRSQVDRGRDNAEAEAEAEEQKARACPPEPDAPESKPAKQEPSRFPEFWAVYPRKEGKKPAETAWRSKKLDRIADDLIADVQARTAKHRQWLDGFVPHAVTYLRQERWQDEISGAAKPNGAHQPRTSNREAPMLPRLDLGAAR